MINLDKNTIQKICEEVGTSVYIFNQDEFEQNYRALEQTFRNIYQNYHVCYSYKTNYTPEICKCVKNLGGYAEVVSDMEYELALKLNYTANKIVFNGPVKGKYLQQHLLNGGINNIDRMEEAEYVCSIANKYKDKVIKTGVRINFDIDAGYTSRFGIDINNIQSVFDLLRNNNVTVSGLHCHMSRARGIEAWKCRAKTMINIVEMYRLDKIEYISLGSGMYGKMDSELQKQFPADAPSYQEYAEVVMGEFAAYYKDKDNAPMIFTEPGTTLVSRYVDYLGCVQGIKKIRGNMFILMNCSFHNLGEACQMKNLPIRRYDFGTDICEVSNANLVGYTCLEQDVLYRGYTGAVSIGDVFLFGNVGGYSIVNKPPFIMPNTPFITVKDDKIKLIKRQETWNDIFSTFVF